MLFRSAPPLSLLPVAVNRMRRWIEEHKKNLIVVHCKVSVVPQSLLRPADRPNLWRPQAGKGRSGTVAVAYLLSLLDLPKLPEGVSSPLIPPPLQEGPAAMDSKLQSVRLERILIPL